MSINQNVFYNINHNPMYNTYMDTECNDSNDKFKGKNNMALEPMIPLSAQLPQSSSKYVNISNTYVESFEKNDKTHIKYKVVELFFKFKGDLDKVYEKIEKTEETEKITETLHSRFHLLETSIKKLIEEDKDDRYVNIYDLCSDFLFFHCNERDFCMWLESNTSIRSIKIRFIVIELKDFFSILDLKTV